MSNSMIMFTAAWCAPCKIVKPLVSELSELFPDVHIKYVDVDSDEGQTLVEKYAIRGVPSLLTVDESGNMVDNLVGSSTKGELSNFFEKAVGNL